MIHCLWNPHASIILDKWRFDLIWNKKTLALDIGSFSTNDLADKTFRAFGFYISIIRYFEKGLLYFIIIINLKLFAKLVIIDNSSKGVTDSEEEMVEKRTNTRLKKRNGLQNFVFLLNLSRLFVLNPLLFCCLILCLLLYLFLWPLLFFILDPLLFYYLVINPLLFLIFDLSLFCWLVICPFLFLILDPLLFCYFVIYLLWLYFQLFHYLVMHLFFVAEF